MSGRCGELIRLTQARLSILIEQGSQIATLTGPSRPNPNFVRMRVMRPKLPKTRAAVLPGCSIQQGRAMYGWPMHRASWLDRLRITNPTGGQPLASLRLTPDGRPVVYARGSESNETGRIADPTNGLSPGSRKSGRWTWMEPALDCWENWAGDEDCEDIQISPDGQFEVGLRVGICGSPLRTWSGTGRTRLPHQGCRPPHSSPGRQLANSRTHQRQQHRSHLGPPHGAPNRLKSPGRASVSPLFAIYFCHRHNRIKIQCSRPIPRPLPGSYSAGERRNRNAWTS
jgi:hypothetical protein